MSKATGPTHLAPPEGIGDLRRERLGWARLYFVCEALPHGRDPEPMLQAALAGGAGMVELRDRDVPEDALQRAAGTFRRLADTHSALFIVNDDPHLARELGADGVHVGQDDMDPAEARSILGPDAIIGLSTHSPEQVGTAQEQPVDYVSVGPIWQTPTKEGRPATGLDLLGRAAESSRLPWFAIGGIDEENVEQVVAAGARRICVVRAIRDAENPRGAAAALLAPIEAAVAREPT